MNIVEFKVDGMTCNHCKANVEKGLNELEEVINVVADPDKNIVQIHADSIDEEAVKSKVEGLGYLYRGKI